MEKIITSGPKCDSYNDIKCLFMFCKWDLDTHHIVMQRMFSGACTDPRFCCFST